MIGRYDAAGKDGKPGITYLQEGLDDDATQFGLIGGNNITKFDTRSEDPRRSGPSRPTGSTSSKSKTCTAPTAATAASSTASRSARPSPTSAWRSSTPTTRRPAA